MGSPVLPKSLHSWEPIPSSLGQQSSWRAVTVFSALERATFPSSHFSGLFCFLKSVDSETGVSSLAINRVLTREQISQKSVILSVRSGTDPDYCTENDPVTQV